MSESTLGTYLNGTEKRDAQHIAVLPVIAAMDLKPGQWIGITTQFDDTVYVSAAAETKLGIVDPFLFGDVKKGKRFWMIMAPNTIDNLRHDWDHDDVKRPEPEPEPGYQYDDSCRHC